MADEVTFTNLEASLFPGAEATKGDLVDYLDAVADRLIPQLTDRPLSVIRVTRGQSPFMQKNLPKHAPDWIATAPIWAEASQRTVNYPLCNDERTLLWFANQRAVEFHTTLTRVDRPDTVTHLVLDLDPPDADGFPDAVHAALTVREALRATGLDGAVKTSGAKGVHVFVPLDPSTTIADAAAATHAIAHRTAALDPDRLTTEFLKDDRGDRVFVDSTRSGWSTVIAAYSPRARPGVPVSFPVAWDDLDAVTPRDFTIHNAASLLAEQDTWQSQMPSPQPLPADLVAEGHEIPTPRVVAMHEGKRRARARKD